MDNAWLYRDSKPVRLLWTPRSLSDFYSLGLVYSVWDNNTNRLTHRYTENVFIRGLSLADAAFRIGTWTKIHTENLTHRYLIPSNRLKFYTYNLLLAHCTKNSTWDYNLTKMIINVLWTEEAQTMFKQNLLHPSLCTKGHQLKQAVITSCVEVNTLLRLVERIGQQNGEEMPNSVGATMHYLALLRSWIKSSHKRSPHIYLMA